MNILTKTLLILTLVVTPMKLYAGVTPVELREAKSISMEYAEQASKALSIFNIAIDAKTLHGIAGIESTYGLNTTNKYTRAIKVMQITPSTRRYIISKYKWLKYFTEGSLKEYILAGCYLDYIRKYYGKYNVADKPENLYLGYLLGPWYGVKTIRDHRKKRSKHMSSIVSKVSYRNNRTLLNRSSKRLVKLIRSKLRSKGGI